MERKDLINFMTWLYEEPQYTQFSEAKVSYEDLLSTYEEHLKPKPPKISITVKVAVDTFKTKEEVMSGINKGIYWGLDVRGVAAPSAVTLQFLEE